MKKEIFRYFVFILGLFFLSLGIDFIVSSTLGTTPISSVNYVVTLHTSISLGTATFLINVLLILGQFWLIRGRGSRKETFEILLQIPFSFLFSLFIDMNMLWVGKIEPTSYWMSLLMLAIGCLMQAIGIVLEVKPNVAIMSGEGFVKYASRRYNKEFGRVKLVFDISLVLTALILSVACSGHPEGIREGTLVAACCTGFLVTFLSRYVITGRNFRRLIPQRQIRQ